jgi:hypothetical protein
MSAFRATLVPSRRLTETAELFRNRVWVICTPESVVAMAAVLSNPGTIDEPTHLRGMLTQFSPPNSMRCIFGSSQHMIKLSYIRDLYVKFNMYATTYFS